ncbi:MAG: hypothetical protein ACLSHC_11155 [Bilophila wadsworthia]
MPIGQKPASTMPSGSGLVFGRARKSSLVSSGLTNAALKPSFAKLASVKALAALQNGPAPDHFAALEERPATLVADKMLRAVAYGFVDDALQSSSSSGQMTGGSHHAMFGATVRDTSRIWAKATGRSPNCGCGASGAMGQRSAERHIRTAAGMRGLGHLGVNSTAVGSLPLPIQLPLPLRDELHEFGLAAVDEEHRRPAFGVLWREAQRKVRPSACGGSRAVNASSRPHSRLADNRRKSVRYAA